MKLIIMGINDYGGRGYKFYYRFILKVDVLLLETS